MGADRARADGGGRADPAGRAAIREKLAPDSWLAPLSECALGQSLAAQAKYAEAEPLLVRGYERLAKAAVPPSPWDRVFYDGRRATAEYLVHLCEATGKPAEAKKWRAEAAKYPHIAPAPRAVR